MIRRRVAPIVLALSIALLPVRGFCGEQGHYIAGGWSPRDLISPPPGTFVFAPYVSFYNADRARNGRGDLIDGGDGLQVSAEAWSFTPVITFSPSLQPLGADWGITVVPAYGEAGAAARYSTSEFDIDLFDNNGRGWGDLYVVPANLSWKLSDYFTVSTQYSVWAPVGEYDPKSADNVGLGYTSHNFRGTLSYFPLGNPGILLSASVLHEVNGKKRGFDVTPGDHTSGELGVSVAISEKLIVGAQGFGMWETSDTSGQDAVDDGRDRMVGIGGEVMYWFQPGELGCALRVNKELEVRDRFEGETYTVGMFFFL